MRSDGPPPSWYEPPDLDDDDHEPDVPEPLVISDDIVAWTRAHDDD